VVDPNVVLENGLGRSSYPDPVKERYRQANSNPTAVNRPIPMAIRMNPVSTVLKNIAVKLPSPKVYS